LAEIVEAPHRSWRLNKVSLDAQMAVTLTRQANEVLVGASVAHPLPIVGLESLSQVADYLAQVPPFGQVA
jgi:hypothetical protein